MSPKGRKRHGCNTVKEERKAEIACGDTQTCTRMHAKKQLAEALLAYTAKKEEWQVSNADGSGKHPLFAFAQLCLPPNLTPFTHCIYLSNLILSFCLGKVLV